MFNLIRIEKFVENHARVTQCLIGKYCLFRKEKGLDLEKLTVLGVLLRKSRKLYFTAWNDFNQMLHKINNLCVVFDHALGGGTETYFKNKVAKCRAKTNFLRIQYFRRYELYLVTLYFNQIQKSSAAPSFEALVNMLMGGGKTF